MKIIPSPGEAILFMRDHHATSYLFAGAIACFASYNLFLGVGHHSDTIDSLMNDAAQDRESAQTFDAHVHELRSEARRAEKRGDTSKAITDWSLAVKNSQSAYEQVIEAASDMSQAVEQTNDRETERDAAILFGVTGIVLVSSAVGSRIIQMN